MQNDIQAYDIIFIEYSKKKKYLSIKRIIDFKKLI